MFFIEIGVFVFLVIHWFSRAFIRVDHQLISFRISFTTAADFLYNIGLEDQNYDCSDYYNSDDDDDRDCGSLCASIFGFYAANLGCDISNSALSVSHFL